MIQISPLLQAKLDKTNNNDNNCIGYEAKNNLASKPDSFEKTSNTANVNNDKQKNKIIKHLVIGIGAAAAIGLGILALVKHKKPVELEKGVKKFFDKDNNFVDGIKLEKGKALKPDGTLFSGLMETVNKKGEEYVLEYNNGNIVKSIKNGKLLKTYDYNYAENGAILSKKIHSDKKAATHFFDNNSKIRQIYASNGKCAEFSNGKKIAEYSEYDYVGKIFDENGKVIKDMKGKNSSYVYTYYNSDGEVTKEVESTSLKKLPKFAEGESIANLEIKPEKITYYSKGEPIKTLDIKYYEDGSSKFRMYQGKTNEGKAKNIYSICIPSENQITSGNEDILMGLDLLDDSGKLIMHTEEHALLDLDYYYEEVRPKSLSDIEADRHQKGKESIERTKSNLFFNQKTWNEYASNMKEAAQLAQKDGMGMNFDVLFKFLNDFEPLNNL